MSAAPSDVDVETAADTHPLLTRNDIRTFDGEATALVMRAQEHGWRGYLTRNNHVFLKAPDGVATMSVSRESLRGRSGRNAKAVLERWIKAQAVSDERTEDAAPGAAFGDLMPPVEPLDTNLPAAMLIGARKQGLYDWIMTHQHLRPGKDFLMWGDEDRTLDPYPWFAVDLRRKGLKVIGRGTQVTDEKIAQVLLELKPWLKERIVQVFGNQVIEQGGKSVRVLLCDHEGCDYQTHHAGAMNLHRHKHDETVVKCEVCGREGSRSGIAAHAARAHGDRVARTCPVCGKGDLVGAMGLKTHLRRSHRFEADRVEQLLKESEPGRTPPVPQDETVTVTVEDVTVAPPVEPPVAPAPTSVVMEHLTNLPEGADAEAQIAQVRAIVAAPLVAEVGRLTEDNNRLEKELKELTQVNGELEAKLSLLREALGL